MRPEILNEDVQNVLAEQQVATLSAVIGLTVAVERVGGGRPRMVRAATSSGLEHHKWRTAE